jgi:hypothetical protein
VIFSLDVRRARKGDCFLLHFGEKREPGVVMIDGGPKDVYKPQLKPRIQQIRTARGLSKQDPLEVELLMVSHVDDDHIQGILDMTREMIVTKNSRQPQVVNILRFWHNSFDAIIGKKPQELTSTFKSHFGAAGLEGELSEAKAAEVEDEASPELTEQGVVADSLKVLSSIEQGYRLRNDSTNLGFPPNSEFDGKLLMAQEHGKCIEIGQGLTFTVVGPMKPELQALYEKHNRWLEDLEKQRKSPPSALAAYIDPSVTNLSSLVVLAQASDKRMLLTGDARGDKILQGLQLTGLIGADKKSRINVDLLKIPHHGSSNNLDQDFFERIIAEHYVFSGNGEHGNPERETLQMLLQARGDEDYMMHFTYPLAEIDIEREKDWNKQQQKQKNRKRKNPEVEVREGWSAKEHSLIAFFEANKYAAKKVRVVEPDRTHVIDLLEPVNC